MKTNIFRIRPYLKRGEAYSLSAKQAMDGILGLLGFEKDAFAIFEIWDREIKGLIPGCPAVALRGTQIHVRVRSAVHRHELMYLKDQIINRINQAMGRKAVTGVQFEFDSDTGGSRTIYGRNNRI